ncbi:MAG: type II secretion system protein GspD [Luteolibacter sp.]
MTVAKSLTFSFALLAGALLHAQTPADPLIEPVAAPETAEQEIPGSENTQLAPPDLSGPGDLPVPTDLPVSPSAPVEAEDPSAPGAAATFAPLEQQKKDMQNADEGFIIKEANLNDIFQFLAKSAGRQYFHNSKIGGPEYLVTGHLNDGKPLEQMEELAFMYGLSLHTKGNTIYALTQAQLAQLPNAEFHYQLRYLRPTDMEQIKELIKPMLSPGTGIVNFEPKTNTVIIIDSAHRIEQARALLHGIDKAKGQVIIETKILRVNSTAAERTGVNWASSLGRDGTSIAVASNLNSVFGLNNGSGPAVDAGDALSEASLVLSPVQVSGVLRALAEGVLARQISNPALITEDNEQATISFIDRVPIITSTVTQNTSGGNPTVTEEVRYTIDQSDPTMATDPNKHRELGISMVVTPTVLPDGTVRMKIRPRSAQIVENITSLSGNTYPRVSESMIESIARVPDGYSLIIGGFYGESESKGNTKIPLLGDIPALNFFFKSKEATKEKTSLVFIVTPSSYDPTKRGSTQRASDRFSTATQIDCDHDWVNQDNPGPAHEANMKRTLRGLQPTQAPFYPRAEDLAPRKASSSSAPSQSKATSGRNGNR